MPPLREEEAISSAIVQRFNVQRDTLADEENRARGQIETLKSRIEQLGNDISRESGLNKDAEETIARLDWEQKQIEKASLGHQDKLNDANVAARDAASILQDKESGLDKHTEDAARLSARHQSANRRLDEAKALLEKRQTDSELSSKQSTICRARLGRSTRSIKASNINSSSYTRSYVEI